MLGAVSMVTLTSYRLPNYMKGIGDVLGAPKSLLTIFDGLGNYFESPKTYVVFVVIY